MGAGSDSNPDVLLIKHRRRSKRNIALFDQLTAPNKAFAQGSSFPWNFLNHRGQNSLAVHGWVWVALASYWSGNVRIAGCGLQVQACSPLLTVHRAFPDLGNLTQLCLSWPNLSEASLYPLLRQRNFSKLLWIPKTFDKSPLERDKCHFSHKKQFHPEESTIVSVFSAAGLFCSVLF